MSEEQGTGPNMTQLSHIGMLFSEILHRAGPIDGLPKVAACLASTSKTYRDILYDTDFLWHEIFVRELGIDRPRGPQRNAAGVYDSYRQAYQVWRNSFIMYDWALVTRVNRCYDGLYNWLDANFPEAVNTMRHGATEKQLNYLEATMGVKLPPPTRVLYRFFDGQGSYGVSISDGLLGLIGGYLLYDLWTNGYILPLSEIILRTKEEVSKFDHASHEVMVAKSSLLKAFFLDCRTGFLYVNRVSGLIPCVPQAQVTNRDGMLLWLEEHLQRLQLGIIGVRVVNGRRMIGLIPEAGPLYARVVYNGIQVRVSSAYTPENSHDERHKHIYSVRMRSLPVEGQQFLTCQLYQRRWITSAVVDGDVENLVEDFTGDGVADEFPVLQVGGPEYEYVSVAKMPVLRGSLHGFYQFRHIHYSIEPPGELPLMALVPRILLEIPDYIY